MRFHGSLENPYSIGTNKLIKNGAYLITDVIDILEKYPEFLKRKKKNFEIRNNAIKEEYKDIYNIINNNFQSVDNISVKSGTTLGEVINTLVLMELDGIVEFKMGLGYRKKEK